MSCPHRSKLNRQRGSCFAQCEPSAFTDAEASLPFGLGCEIGEGR